MRSQPEARSDALEHASELCDALQDADASEDLIDSAERMLLRVEAEVTDIHSEVV